MFTEMETLLLDFMSSCAEQDLLDATEMSAIANVKEFNEEQDFMAECDKWELENVLCGLMSPSSYDVIDVLEDDILEQIIPESYIPIWNKIATDINLINTVAEYEESQIICEQLKKAIDEDEMLEKLLPLEQQEDFQVECNKWLQELDRIHV